MTTSVKKKATVLKKITALKFWVRIVVEKDEPGYYSYAPSLKGLHMGGDTPEEALENAKEAAKLMLKSMVKHGDTIPIDVLELKAKGKVYRGTDIMLSEVAEIKVSS